MNKKDSTVQEEVPANAVGGGNIAGLGVGTQGEPGINKKKKFIMNFKEYIKRKQLEKT